MYVCIHIFNQSLGGRGFRVCFIRKCDSLPFIIVFFRNVRLRDCMRSGKWVETEQTESFSYVRIYCCVYVLICIIVGHKANGAVEKLLHKPQSECFSTKTNCPFVRVNNFIFIYVCICKSVCVCVM